MDNIINIGVLGCANIAKRSVIPNLVKLPEQFRLVGIASRNHDSAVGCAKEFSAMPYVGYQSLFNRADLQAVYIPLPNSLHAEWIEIALRSGINVLVEKSLATEYQEVLRLNMLAEEKGLALVENFQFRFHSQLEYIKNLLKTGVIGELRCLRSSFGFPGLPTENDIRYKKNLGGGALLDSGAYPIKISQIFLGEDVEVKASNLNYFKEKEVDIWGGAYIKQLNGDLFAEIAFGFNHHYQCSVELWGSKGKIYTNRIFTANSIHEPIIILEKHDGTETIKLPFDHHFKNMLLHFHNLIISKKGLNDEYRQNINQARLINELKQKADE